MKQLSKVRKEGYLAIDAGPISVFRNSEGSVLCFWRVDDDGIAVELCLVFDTFLKFLAFLFALNL